MRHGGPVRHRIRIQSCLVRQFAAASLAWVKQRPTHIFVLEAVPNRSPKPPRNHLVNPNPPSTLRFMYPISILQYKDPKTIFSPKNASNHHGTIHINPNLPSTLRFMPHLNPAIQRSQDHFPSEKRFEPPRKHLVNPYPPSTLRFMHPISILQYKDPKTIRDGLGIVTSRRSF